MVHFRRVTGERLLGLKSVAGNAYYRSFISAYPSLRNQLLCSCDRNAPCSLGKNALSLCKQLYPIDNFFIGNILCIASGFLDDMASIVSVGRVADGKRFGNCIRLDRFYYIGTLLYGSRYGRTTCGLRRKHLCPEFFDQPYFPEFLKCLPHLCKKRAAGTGHNYIIGCFPSQLFDNLETLRLGALCVKRPDVYIDKGPRILIGDLAAKPVDFIVIAIYSHKVGFIYQRGHYLALLQ